MAKIEATGKPVNTVLAGASERLRSQRGTRERFKRGLEISGRYDLQFRKIFRDAGLPEDLAYLPHVESSFQLTAKSSAGAVGLWQFTNAAAKTFIPGHDKRDQRYDPFVSANGAARYLSYAYGKLGDWPAAVTSYNHGIGGMKRAQNTVGNDFNRIVDNYDGPAFGFASRNYYAQFLAAREIAANPHQYFREGVSYEAPVGPSQYLAAE
jgi:membrane-bound lytic murein transglycosylase D